MKKFLKVIGWGFLIVIALSALELIIPDAPPSAYEKKYDAKYYCFERVKMLLKTPSVANFGSPDFDKDFQIVDDNQIKLRSYVDSQNSFGAMLRKNFICTVKLSPPVVKVDFY